MMFLTNCIDCFDELWYNNDKDLNKEGAFMGWLFKVLTGDIVGKTLDAAAEGIYEGLFDKDAPMHDLKPGDVIGIKRPAGYEHYAVYAGNGKVIHYAAENGDFGEATIHEAPFEDFLNGQQTFFVLDFSEVGKRPSKQHKGHPGRSILRHGLFGLTMGAISKAAENRQDSDIEHIYSRKETLARARSRIGESSYSLVSNNCEHFAIWCKTGVDKSYQVNDVLESVAPLPLLAMNT